MPHSSSENCSITSSLLQLQFDATSHRFTFNFASVFQKGKFKFCFCFETHPAGAYIWLCTKGITLGRAQEAIRGARDGIFQLLVSTWKILSHIRLFTYKKIFHSRFKKVNSTAILGFIISSKVGSRKKTDPK